MNKKECQKRINKINGVCRRCGRKPEPIKTVDNLGNQTYWAGCYHGDKKREWCHLDWGVSKELYELAYKLVKEDDVYWGMEKDSSYSFDHLFEEAVARNVSRLQTVERLKKQKPRHTKTELRKTMKRIYNIK